MNDNTLKGFLILLDLEKDQHSKDFLLNLIDKHINLFDFTEEQLKTLEQKKKEILQYKRSFSGIKNRFKTKNVLKEYEKNKQIR